MEAVKDRPLLALTIALFLGGTGGYHSNDLIESCNCEQVVNQAIRDEKQDCEIAKLKD